VNESTKAVLRTICRGFLVLVIASMAACSMPSSSGSSGPPYTVTYRNTTVYTTGSVPVDFTQYPANATVTVMGNSGSLSWPGFTFLGWNTVDSGSDGGGGGGTFYASGATFAITSNVVLYGTWNP
jgi:hypothetical protein